MPNSPTYGSELLDSLRRIIRDTSYQDIQFEAQVGSPASAATVEVQDNTLSFDCTGVSDLDIDLTDSLYDTIEKVVNYINSSGTGYFAELLADSDPAHDSTDLKVMIPTVCLNKKVQFKTRRWSDAELGAAVDRAVSRHNMNVPRDPTMGFTANYTSLNVPEDHKQFVLLLAQIEVYNSMIQLGIKRRGLDMKAEDFVAIVKTLEDRYSNDLKRWMEIRKNQVVDPDDLEDLGSGDVVLGFAVRNSLRTGTAVPQAGAKLPRSVSLSATALGSGKVKLEWSRNRDDRFWMYEIWRGDTSDVSNFSEFVTPAGSVDATGTKIRTETRQWATNFVDGVTEGALTPGTYYYIIYVFAPAIGTSESRYNYSNAYQKMDFAASEVVQVTVT